MNKRLLNSSTCVTNVKNKLKENLYGTSQLAPKEKATGEKGPATAIKLGTYALSRSFSHTSHGDRPRSSVPHRPYVPYRWSLFPCRLFLRSFEVPYRFYTKCYTSSRTLTE